MGGATKQIGVTVTSKCKESVYCKNKEREELGGFDHKFSSHHNAPFIGYIVTNTLYNTIKAVKGVWGLAPRKILTNVLLTRLEKAPLYAYTGMSEEPFG